MELGVAVPFFCRFDGAAQLVASWPAKVAALGLAAWALAALCGLMVGVDRGDRALLAFVAGSSAVFQCGHLGEHMAQLAGLAVTTDTLTVTPWAKQLVAGLAWVWQGSAETGLEMMHMLGDSVFLSGVAAWRCLHPGPWATAALVAQGLHMTEHLFLGFSTLAFGAPLGLTVVGPVWWRVLVHWSLNFAGSAAWAVSAWEVHRA